ncbi:MAG: aminotransferase class V-fold PLP-dependent enzyme [Micromonosporaceae bacterium]|nr:aminotransferase class V-fold PLP-dependent enzyme [Micromonosporaceae bacterium]
MNFREAADQLNRAEQLDRADPLAPFRDRFVVTDPQTIYLDGNSLGRLPLSTRERLHRAVDEEWGGELVRGWAHWLDIGRAAGDVLAGILGAHQGEVVLADSTSVNLYKLASAALDAVPHRRVIVTEEQNFPTDRYVLQGLAAARGLQLRAVPNVDLAAALDDGTALLCLSHVDFRTGAVADLPGLTAAAHRVGAMVLWDLCHSAGVLPVGLAGAAVDLAVGCTYKHLHAGPGAPAFLYVRRDLQDRLRQPIWGWFGQADQFAMGEAYHPVPGIERFLAGTPGVLGGYAAWEGARLTAEAGVPAIAAKARALGRYAIELSDAWLAPLGFSVASPRADHRRGAQVALRHPEAWRVCQALLDQRVVPDFRTPDLLRLGLAPLYTRFVDVHTGLSRLRDLVLAGRHLDYPEAHARVT